LHLVELLSTDQRQRRAAGDGEGGDDRGNYGNSIPWQLAAGNDAPDLVVAIAGFSVAVGAKSQAMVGAGGIYARVDGANLRVMRWERVLVVPHDDRNAYRELRRYNYGQFGGREPQHAAAGPVTDDLLM
jgi:hypothetical protein